MGRLVIFPTGEIACFEYLARYQTIVKILFRKFYAYRAAVGTTEL